MMLKSAAGRAGEGPLADSGVDFGPERIKLEKCAPLIPHLFEKSGPQASPPDPHRLSESDELVEQQAAPKLIKTVSLVQILLRRDEWEDRFWSKTIATGCGLDWAGALKAKSGYGQIMILGRNRLAHRVAWALEHGNIPKGHVVRHGCDRPICVHIDCLSVGTAEDNYRDMIERGRGGGVVDGGLVLTEEKVLWLRQEAKNGATYTELSRTLDVSLYVVRDAAIGRTWKHVGGPIATIKRQAKKEKA